MPNLFGGGARPLYCGFSENYLNFTFIPALYVILLQTIKYTSRNYKICIKRTLHVAKLILQNDFTFDIFIPNAFYFSLLEF
jgi:hypothetical protein